MAATDKLIESAKPLKDGEILFLYNRPRGLAIVEHPALDLKQTKILVEDYGRSRILRAAALAEHCCPVSRRGKESIAGGSTRCISDHDQRLIVIGKPVRVKLEQHFLALIEANAVLILKPEWGLGNDVVEWLQSLAEP